MKVREIERDGKEELRRKSAFENRRSLGWD
jgi:hypothetical protein